jgi:hypothetical protein
VRSALRRQPTIPAFRPATQERREWAGNASFSHFRLRLQAPKSAIAWPQSAKVSGHAREYSRFAETAGRDRGRSRLPRARHSQTAAVSSLGRPVLGVVHRLLTPGRRGAVRRPPSLHLSTIASRNHCSRSSTWSATIICISEWD